VGWGVRGVLKEREGRSRGSVHCARVQAVARWSRDDALKQGYS